MVYRGKWRIDSAHSTRQMAEKKVLRLRTQVGINALLTEGFNPEGTTVYVVWVDLKEDGGA